MDELQYVSPRDCWEAVNDRVFVTEEFSIKDIVLGAQRSISFYSHGSRDEHGNCDVATFVRKNKQYEYSYEKSRADLLVKLIPAHTTDGVLAGTAGEDILLPDGLRLPATKTFYSSPALGTVV